MRCSEEFSDGDTSFAMSPACFCFRKFDKETASHSLKAAPALPGTSAPPSRYMTSTPAPMLDSRIPSFASGSYTPDRGSPGRASPAIFPSRLRAAASAEPFRNSPAVATARASSSGQTDLEPEAATRALREGSWLSRSFARSFRGVEAAFGKMRRRRAADDGTGNADLYSSHNVIFDGGVAEHPDDRSFDRLCTPTPPNHMPAADLHEVDGMLLNRIQQNADGTQQQEVAHQPPASDICRLLVAPAATPPAAPIPLPQQEPCTMLTPPLPTPKAQAGCWDRLTRRHVPDRNATQSSMLTEMTAAASAVLLAAQAATAAACAATAAAQAAEAQCHASMVAVASMQQSCSQSGKVNVMPRVSACTEAQRNADMPHTTTQAMKQQLTNPVDEELAGYQSDSSAPLQHSFIPYQHGEPTPGSHVACLSSSGVVGMISTTMAENTGGSTSPQKLSMSLCQCSDGTLICPAEGPSPRSLLRQHTPYAHSWPGQKDGEGAELPHRKVAPGADPCARGIGPEGSTARSASVGKLELYRNLTLKLEQVSPSTSHPSVASSSQLGSPTPAASPTRRGVRFMVQASVGLPVTSSTSDRPPDPPYISQYHLSSGMDRPRLPRGAVMAGGAADPISPGPVPGDILETPFCRRRWSVDSRLQEITSWETAFQGQGEMVRRELQRIFSCKDSSSSEHGQAAATAAERATATASQMASSTPPTSDTPTNPSPLLQDISDIVLSPPGPLLQQQHVSTSGAAAAARIAAVAAISQQHLTSHILSQLNGHQHYRSAVERIITPRHDFRRPAETGSPLHSSIGSTASEPVTKLVPLQQLLSNGDPPASWGRCFSRNSSDCSGVSTGVLQRPTRDLSFTARGRALARGASPSPPPAERAVAAAPPASTAPFGFAKVRSMLRSSSTSGCQQHGGSAFPGPALLVTPSRGSFTVTRSRGSLSRMAAEGFRTPTGRAMPAQRTSSSGGGAAHPPPWENDENSEPLDAPHLQPATIGGAGSKPQRLSRGCSDAGSCLATPCSQQGSDGGSSFMLSDTVGSDRACGAAGVCIF